MFVVASIYGWIFGLGCLFGGYCIRCVVWRSFRCAMYILCTSWLGLFILFVFCQLVVCCFVIDLGWFYVILSVGGCGFGDCFHVLLLGGVWVGLFWGL